MTWNSIVQLSLYEKSSERESFYNLWTFDTYIMSDNQLAYLLTLGLDILSQTGVQLNVGEHSYGLKLKGCWSVFPFLKQPIENQTPKQIKHSVLLYMALSLEGDNILETQCFPKVNVFSDLIKHYPPEL